MRTTPRFAPHPHARTRGSNVLYRRPKKHASGSRALFLIGVVATLCSYLHSECYHGSLPGEQAGGGRPFYRLPAAVAADAPGPTLICSGRVANATAVAAAAVACRREGTVVLTLTASGSVNDYSDSDKSSLQQKVADAAGVDKSLVTIRVTAASVRITATIAVPASMAADEVQTSLASTLGTAAAASAALGLTIEEVPTIVVLAELPPPSPSLPPSPSRPTTAPR